MTTMTMDILRSFKDRFSMPVFNLTGKLKLKKNGAPASGDAGTKDEESAAAASASGGSAYHAYHEGTLYVLWKFVLPVLLGLSLGWFGAVCLGVALDGLAGPASSRQGALRTETRQESRNARAGLDDFLAANPFRVSPMKPVVVEETKPQEDAAEVTGSLATAVLRGTLPKVGAWLEDSGNLRLVLVGSSFDVYTLDEVTYREAVFVKDDEQVTRELYFGPLPVKRPPVPKAAAPAVTANVPVGNVVPARPGEQDGQVPSGLVNQLVQNPFDELKKVRLRPRGESGLQIQWIQNDSILKKLGVQKGDVIKSINGIPFNNMADIANSINSLMNSERFDVEVDRKGKATALRYVVR